MVGDMGGFPTLQEAMPCGSWQPGRCSKIESRGKSKKQQGLERVGEEKFEHDTYAKVGHGTYNLRSSEVLDS